MEGLRGTRRIGQLVCIEESFSFAQIGLAGLENRPAILQDSKSVEVLRLFSFIFGGYFVGFHVLSI